MTKPRIVIMASSLGVLGGAQRVAHVLADQLSARGYPVDLVGIAPTADPHDYGVSPAIRRFTLMEGEWPAMPVDLTDSGKRLPPDAAVISQREAMSAAAAAALTPVLADGPPGVIVATQLWAMEHLARVPHHEWAVIGQYHSSIEAASAGPDLQRALDLYVDVDAVALLTAADADAMRRAGLNNTTWLPNPLAFWPKEPVTYRSDSAGIVGYLGRLSHEKGVTYLVDAWGRIADRYPGWRLRLVGSGAEESALRDQTRRLAAGGDRVEFRPPVTDAESELRGCDVVVLPSLTEGLPLALAEAMALGLPCIATDCSAGVRMLSGDGRAARLVPRADAGALAAHLSALMDSPAEREALGRSAREAVTPYRADTVTDMWERLITDVLR